MKKFFNKIKTFFVELRRKPEKERQKWLWIFVSVSIFIVFIFWFSLFKNNVQVVDVNPTPTPMPTAVASDNSNGFLRTLYVGWQRTSTFVVEKVKAVGGIIGNFLAGIFSYSFQGWKKMASIFDEANSYLEREFTAYFKVLGSLVSSDL